MLTDENIRFFRVVEDLKANGQLADYVQLAATLGTNKAGISDLKSGRKKISIDALRRMKSSYPTINLNWIIMGDGDMYCTELATKHVTATPDQSEIFKQFTAMLDQKDSKLLEQAEEMGRLRERIDQLEARVGKNEAVRHRVPQTSEVAP